jgi:Transcription factor AFT
MDLLTFENPLEPAVASAVTPLLASQIQQAIKSLPPANLILPASGESFDSPANALRRLQDWAFTQGFAVVTESTRKDRVIFECVHHKKKTKNCRKTATEDRQRVCTATRAKDCKWGVYVSQRKSTKKEWILGWSHKHHSHHLNPDPFSFEQHEDKCPGFVEALARATVHRGVASYSTSLKMLQKEGLLDLTAKKYYGLLRKADREGETLTKQEEIQVLLQYLEDHNFHVQVRYEHVIDDDGNRTNRRVVRDIFFINDT